MSFFDWFKTEPKSTKELQAELHALVDKIIARRYIGVEDNRYEAILKELYLRGETPDIKLVIK